MKKTVPLVIRHSDRNYVNNEEFVKALKEFKTLRLANALEGKARPIIPRFIAECFMKIANNFAMRKEFYYYTFKDEMVADAILNCTNYIDSFDPDRGSSAFSYFTQACFSAFIRRISIEKTHHYIRAKKIQMAFEDNPAMFEEGMENDQDGMFDNSTSTREAHDKIISAFETKHFTKKEAKRKKAAENPNAISDALFVEPAEAVVEEKKELPE